MKNSLLILALVLIFTAAVADEYKIVVKWDIFGGDINAIVNGTIGQDIGFVDGVSPGRALQGKLVSEGEGLFGDSGQAFIIKSDNGIFSLWLRDKFGDDDVNPDPTLIASSSPQIHVFKNGSLIEAIQIDEGLGLTCKVLTLDAASGEVEVWNRFYPRSRIIFGRIVDAVQGTGLEGVTVLAEGRIDFSQIVKTDQDGYFMIPVEVGTFRLSFSKDGYIPLEMSVNMGPDENPREVFAAMTGMIRNFRIVLTWGQRPADLDAHLSGPDPDGGRFHIWYRHKVMVGGRDFLDRDDVSSYGPETVTIYRPGKGEYLYSVHDYTNRKISNSRSLARSGATVHVYAENRLLSQFTVPEGTGTVWHVFKIDAANRIVPINSMEFVRTPSQIHD